MEDENDKTLKNNNYEEPNYSIGIVEQKLTTYDIVVK